MRTGHSVRRAVALTAVGLVAILGLAGCKNGGNGDATTPNAVIPTPAPVPSDYTPPQARVPVYP